MTTVMTRGIAERVATDSFFSTLVEASLARFSKEDWGDVDAEDKVANDEANICLAGGFGGRIIASYFADTEYKFWIIRDTIAVTILFPDEY